MKERKKYQGIRRETPEATQFNYSQLLCCCCFKLQKELNGRKIIFSTNGDQALRYTGAKKFHLSLIGHVKITSKDHNFKSKMVNYTIFRSKHMRIFLVIAFGEVLLEILQRLDHKQIDKLGFIKN